MHRPPFPSRRRLLQAGMAIAASAALPAAFAIERKTTGDGRLVVVFLRGGLDGLFVFSPVADPRLAALRPGLSREVLASGIALDRSGFAAHPAGRPLAELYASKELAFAPCFGTTDRNRSHFQAQDLFELGNGRTQGRQGFLARAGEAAGGRVRSIGFGASQPLALQGGDAELMPLTGSGLQMRHDRSLDAIRAMHGTQASGKAIDQALASQAELDRVTGMDPKAARGAAGVNGFPKSAATMARILKEQPRLGLAFIDLGGFDTHAEEEPALSRTLPLLAEGLLALRDGLGPTEWQRTQVLVCTEFGRTVRENGTRGTDHGHGGLALLLGGAIAGGRLIGDFPGLADAQLNEGRDLPVTVDWRSLLGRALKETQGFDTATLHKVLPGIPGLA
jgi:uncharacterized protein (DUF1501 family)